MYVKSVKSCACLSFISGISVYKECSDKKEEKEFQIRKG